MASGDAPLFPATPSLAHDRPVEKVFSERTPFGSCLVQDSNFQVGPFLDP